MIITLNFDPQTVPENSLPSLEATFLKLIEANFKGWHLAVINRTICDWALENLTLPEIYASHLKSIKEKYTTFGGILTAAQIYLSIEVGANILTKVDNQKFTIGHTNFLNSQYCDSPTKLILEDAPNDGAFYDLVFKTIRGSMFIPNYRFDVVHGGGNRTSQVFETNVRNQNISACIVDSDKSSPQCLYSATARQCITEENRFGTILGKVFVTPVREVENFIPMDIYLQIPCNQQFLADLDPIQEILNAEQPNPTFWYFLDVKEGIDGDSICRKNENGQISNSAMQWIQNKIELIFQSIQGANVRGFGTNALANCFNHQPTFKLLHKLFRSDEWKTEFASFFEQIIWYFCSSPKQSFT